MKNKKIDKFRSFFTFFFFTKAYTTNITKQKRCEPTRCLWLK